MPSHHANLAAILVDAAARHPDRPAVRLDGATLRYAELDEASARAASLLRSAGANAGDRVGLMLPNLPAFAVPYYGIRRAGARLESGLRHPIRDPRPWAVPSPGDHRTDSIGQRPDISVRQTKCRFLDHGSTERPAPGRAVGPK
ncbi:AMP-binding protein [Nocardia sp. NBC_00508]|uniref:AMP-binding protein n=1 Tax=Nocardia sp. NBC_00508 TaxID=2975992 RepID=UPI002E814A63|nr:AMP-binding protein [Nocardia sp. NBC_00508]WUD63629.1 AMP-binding protein [Nocardia sp. NBC_00508]